MLYSHEEIISLNKCFNTTFMLLEQSDTQDELKFTN